METNVKKGVLTPGKAFNSLVKNMAKTGIQVFNAIDPETFIIVEREERVREWTESTGRWSEREETPNPLTPAALKKTVETLNYLASYMQISPVACALFVIIMAKQINTGMPVGMPAINGFLAADSMDVNPLFEERDWLEEKGYIRYICDARNGGYLCQEYIVRAIMNNCSFEKPSPMVFDRYKFCEMIDLYITRASQNPYAAMKMVSNMIQLEEKYGKLKMVKKITSILSDEIDRLVFYELCDICVRECTDSATLEDIIENIISESSERYKYVKGFLKKKNPLLVKGLVELRASGMANDTLIALSEMGKEIIYEGDICAINANGSKVSDVIRPEDISDVKLFFEGESAGTISELKNALNEEKFRSLQTRLAEHNLPKGVTAVFYGAPGTGKTEVARQLARETGRAIMHVDISRTKSCWVGESEKLVKSIFSDYRALCYEEKLKPILLFNEADAILTSRIDPSTSHNSSVVQMMNSMQNIILEEMERLDGILIATTNLHTTLDPAFERRFLYKIKFEKPDRNARKNIWMSKMPSLTEEEAMTLSAHHELSGGEIDNVVRKAMISEVLSGNKSCFDKIESYCRSERFSKERNSKIGFQ